MIHLGRRGYWLNLIDFGMCRPIGPSWASFCSGEVKLLPPPGKDYCQWPPELWTYRIKSASGKYQWWHELQVAESFDIWSVGVLYYAMVCVVTPEVSGQRSSVEQLVSKLVQSIEETNG